VGELSQKSAKRLAFLVANAATVFRSMLTLTYRAVFAGVEDALRNAEIVRRSKRDLNRFLSCMRRELGAYFWVQEFQQRGVIHYHVMCESELSQERVALVWCRSIGALGDQAALKHGAKVDPIRGEREARVYLGAYVGKQRQKVLPPGVAAAGRWWGRARSVSLLTLATVVTCTRGDVHHAEIEARIVRAARRYLKGKLGFKYRSGMVLDWGGSLSAGVARVVEDLRRHYGHRSDETAVLSARGWEPAEFLGVSTRTVQRLEDRGILRRCPALGSAVRFPVGDVRKLASADWKEI
jgi:hypothetical protein